MKRTIQYIALGAALVFGACKKDNYTAPDATIQGKITDNHGSPLQMEQGQGSGRLRIEEISWSATPAAQYLNFKIDGSYLNTKLFPGKYRVLPIEGAYYPLDAATKAQEIEIGGGKSGTADFQVVPYLDVQWVGDPVVGTDKKITAKFKFTRNAAPAGLTQPALSDYQLFISTTQYVGNNNFDNTRVGAVVPVTATAEGTELTITSSQPMKYATTFYVRIGVRSNDSFKKYNYTTVKTVIVP